MVIDSEAQGFYQVTATAKDSIKHTKFVRNTLLTVGVSTRILKWSIANESFFYDVLSQLFDFSFDLDGDGEVSIDELMIGDWMIDFGRKYMLKFLAKTSNFCINEYLKVISATTFYLVIPAPSKESNQIIPSNLISSELPPDSSKVIEPKKDFSMLKSNNAIIIKISQFLSKYEAIENTGVKLQFAQDFIEVGIQTSDFFISEKFPLEEGQSEINGLVEVNAVHFIEIVSALSKQGQEITFELKDKLLHLTPNTFIAVERVVPTRPPKAKSIVVIPDPSLLRWFAELSMLPKGKNGELPPNPYIDGDLSKHGLRLRVANPLAYASHFCRIEKLEDWGSSISKDTYSILFLPAKAILKLPSNEAMEIRVGGQHLLLKAGTMTVKIERFKDPLNAYIESTFKKRGSLSVSFDEPQSSTDPSRMEKLINWLDQTKAKACDLIAGPDGIWVKPSKKGENLDFLKSKKIPVNTLQLSDIPCGNTNRIYSFPAEMVIKTIKLLEMKDVRITFPEEQGDILHIESFDEFSELSVKGKYEEILIAEEIPVAELIDEKPLVMVDGETTFIESPTTITEAIETAVATDSIPTNLKEVVQALQEKAEEVTGKNDNISFRVVTEQPKKGKKTVAATQPNDFAEAGQEASNAIVPTHPAEVADAQKAIAETAIVEAINPDNVVSLEPKAKAKAAKVKEAVKATKAELESEIKKTESVDLNRIIALTLKLETLGGRFIEIAFSLHTKWYPTLTITEEVKEEARRQYPQLTQ